MIGDKVYWDPSKEPYRPEESSDQIPEQSGEGSQDIGDSEPQTPPVFNEGVGSGQGVTQVEDEAPPMTPTRESVTEAIMEIASGESPPVVTIDERTGETTVIDVSTAEEIISSDESDIIDAIVSGSLNFHLASSLRRSVDPLDVVSQPIDDVVVTEYMLRTAGIGLPQWIEIHNKSDVVVRLDGWKMSIWSHNDRERVITFSRYVYIPANGFLVLVNRSLEADELGGINTKRVRIHHLRELKASPWIKRFRLYDAEGVLMVNGNQYEPERPELVKGVRYSYDAANKKTIKWHKNKAWIGSPDDRSTLGWHKFVEEVSAAPRLIRKKTLPWASLKRLDK